MKQGTEIEIKVLGIDRAVLIEQLGVLGATLMFDGRITDRQYDYPDRRFHQAQSLLRLRTFSGGHAEITFKGPQKPNEKTKQRTEVTESLGSGDDAIMQSLLEAKGMICIGYQEKDRTSYSLGSVRIDIDQYPGIPCYAEIEGPTEEEVLSAIGTLQLQDRGTSLLSARDLYVQYNSEGDFNNLRFK